MKILVASENGRAVGGAEIYAFSVSRMLSDEGHNVILADASGKSVSGILSDKCKKIDIVTNPLNLMAIAKSFSPDVIYSHGLANPQIEMELGLHWPTVLFNHCYSGTCISGTKLFQVPYFKSCSRAIGPICLAHYFPRRCGGLNPLTAFQSYRREISRQKTFRMVKTVCVASNYMRNVMIQNGVSECKICLLSLFPTHKDPDLVVPVSKSRTDTILLVGRLTRLKGWTHLIPAIALASKTLGRRFTLAIAGDGPDREKLLALAAQYQVPVEWHGWLTPIEVTAKMRQADLLAVPSLWPEPFGLVGIEAGCVGTPAVAYAVGGIPDWLVPGVSGEMAPGDRLHPTNLADAIVRALCDIGHWQSLREGAWRQSFLFSRERHMSVLMQILHAAVSS